MQQEDDLRGLAKVMEFMRAISIVFIVIHVYWFCYSAFVDMGINIGVVDRILLNFQRTARLFSNLLVTKVFAFIFLGLSCLGTKGVKNQKMTWRKIYAAFLGGIVLFFMNWWMLDLPFSTTVNATVYTLTLTTGYILLWYLRIYKDGKYCTFPHAIEFLNKPYADIFTILTSYPSLENYLSPFMDAWQGEAQNQLQGQIASAKIPLSRMISPQLYWVMTGDDFTLDLNNPEHPKILCVGNNPDRQNIYSAALGLYNSRIVKLVNKKGQLKSSIIIDELPTIYFRGIDNLIATARSNKVAVCLGFQDFSQLARDYGDKEAKVIQNTVGNIFSGQVVGETAKSLSERFGKILQLRQSISINRQDTSTSINTQLDSLIPASKIANLSQGTFVGSAKVSEEMKAYRKIPVINEFRDADGNDIMQQQIDRNYSQIKADVLQIIEEEMERIKNDPELRHLIPQQKGEENND